MMNEIKMNIEILYKSATPMQVKNELTPVNKL